MMFVCNWNRFKINLKVVRWMLPSFEDTNYYSFSQLHKH